MLKFSPSRRSLQIHLRTPGARAETRTFGGNEPDLESLWCSDPGVLSAPELNKFDLVEDLFRLLVVGLNFASEN